MTQKRICLWSTPRNVSTALMYSFGSRSDTRVIDEPLYPHFLLHTGAQRPDREETLRAHETDWRKVVSEQFLGDFKEQNLFLKHMPHHMIGVADTSFVLQLHNVFLIRDPRQMITSYIKQVPNPTMLDLGLEMQWKLFCQLTGAGQQPVVIDAKELLTDPAYVLGQLCERVDIPFSETMLSWKAGPRKEDGIWAKYWYQSVHRSTGFLEYREKEEAVPGRLKDLYSECEFYYNKLLAYTLNANQ